MTDLQPTKTEARVNQKVRYDGYWRCEVKDCSSCRVVRPVTEFARDKRRVSGLDLFCYNCRAHQYHKRAKQPGYKRRAKLYRKKYFSDPVNKQRTLARTREWVRRNKERDYLRQKRAGLKFEDQNGMSRFKASTRTPRGRMLSLSRQIKRTYNFPCSVEECAKEFMKREDFKAAFKHWKTSDYQMRWGPIAYAEVETVTSLSDLKITTYGVLSSMKRIKAWKDGKYENRKMALRHNGLDKRCSNGRFVRGAKPVHKQTVGEELAGERVPVEASGRAL